MQIVEAITSGQIRAIWTICLRELKLTRDEVHERIGKDSVKEMSRSEAEEFLNTLNEALGNRMREWYQKCEERFFLPVGVKSVQPVKPGQMRLIIHLAGKVFDCNAERFAGFLLKRKRANRIVTYWQAVETIETLKSMNQRRN